MLLRLLACVPLALLAPSVHAGELRVVVDADGQPFRLAPAHKPTSEIARTCAEPCAIAVSPGQYTLTVGEHEESVLIDSAGTLRYRPASPRVRVTSGIVAASGLLVAGVATYAALEVCRRTYHPELQRTDRPCEDGPSAERYTMYNRVLLATAGIGFTAAVVGGIFFFASGPSVRFVGTDTALVPYPGGLALVGRF